MTAKPLTDYESGSYLSTWTNTPCPGCGQKRHRPRGAECADCDRRHPGGSREEEGCTHLKNTR